MRKRRRGALLALAAAALWLAGAARAAPADATPPVTEILLEPAFPNGLDGWYVSPVTVALVATDEGTGVARTEYSLDGGPWQEYQHPFPVTADGRHTIRFRSVDQAGNAEPVREAALAIDATPPVVTIASPKAGQYGRAGEVRLDWAAQDATSGLVRVEAALDGVPVQPGQVIALRGLELGDHVLEVFATDAAGNEQVAAVVFTVATDPGNLCALTRQYAESGDIRSPVVAARLLSRCQRVGQALTEGDVDLADRLLGSYIAEVRRGSARGTLAQSAGAYLIREAESLRDEMAGGR